MLNQLPLVMIPGPTPVSEPIRLAMARETYGHTYSDFVSIYRECLAGLQTIFQAEKAVVIGGSGTLSMEMALVNTVRAGENLLVISHGLFGDRFIPIAKALGIQADILSSPVGQHVPFERIEQRLHSKRYAAVTLTHVDTSSGVLADACQVGEITKRTDTLFILDGVCASAAIPEPMREYGVDVVLTTCQKAFGTPPGLTMLALGERALARRESLTAVGGYYTDWKNWLPIMDNPSLYFSTPPVNHIVALNESIRLILMEGLAARYDRHQKIACSMRKGLSRLGLEPITAADRLAPTLTVVHYPQGVDDAGFRSAMESAGILVAGGVGELKGKVFRIGHMGNISLNEVMLTLAAVERSLAALGIPVIPGSAVGAAWQEWDSE